MSQIKQLDTVVNVVCASEVDDKELKLEDKAIGEALSNYTLNTLEITDENPRGND